VIVRFARAVDDRIGVARAGQQLGEKRLGLVVEPPMPYSNAAQHAVPDHRARSVARQ